MYRNTNDNLEYERNLNLSERQKRAEDFKRMIDEGTVVSLPADVFLRSNKRKDKESFGSYKRGLRNMKKALKHRLKFGSKVRVYINRNTMEVY